MKYKAGDRVKIKSFDWYNENKDKYGAVPCGFLTFYADRNKYCGKVFTIYAVLNNCYLVKEDTKNYGWTDEMIEGCVESIEDRMKELRKMCTISLTDKNYSDKVEVLLNDYEYIEEEGKSYFVKKKKEYPKTYCECKDILGLWDIDDTERGYYKTDLIDKLQMLLICRDAYWKIAGEKMGLGKPWEPDENEECFSIARSCGEVLLFRGYGNNEVFEFPTTEMRDAFYENFKEEIESCKELL